MLVFDVTDQKSFDSILMFYCYYCSIFPIVFVSLNLGRNWILDGNN